MTAAERVRGLLIDATGEALCGACLALACSISLAEMREVTEALMMSGSFQHRDWCVSCHSTVPATASAKCAHCGRAFLPDEDALEIDGDIFHAACLRDWPQTRTSASRGR